MPSLKNLPVRFRITGSAELGELIVIIGPLGLGFMWSWS